MMADFLTDTRATLARIDRNQVNMMLSYLRRLRDQKHGRLFILGNGGGTGHASHAACDFTKIARIPSYAWGDNASQLTAYANDESWESGIACWLDAHRCGKSDAILVFSVGGASDSVSANLKWAMSWAMNGPVIFGIVGQEGGEVVRYSTTSIIIPSYSTPVVEGVQAVLWHGLVEALGADD